MKNPVPMMVLMVVLPILFLGISIPLVQGRVPPNDFYGVRTAKTKSSPEIWYKANRIGGINIVVATLLLLVVWGILVFLPIGPARYTGDVNILVGIVLVSVVATLFQVSKL